jgi:ribonuclease HIII
MVVFKDVTKEQIATLLKKGYQMDTVKTKYEDLRLSKNDVSLVLYISGKLLVQGKGTDKVVEQLTKLGVGEEVKKQNFRKETGWMIGSDETLKGDTFGGLVVSAVKADDNLRTKLLELGVADSKKLADSEIIGMAKEIKKIAPCEVRSLLPEEYNGRDGNVTKLLDKLHQECANDLLPGKHVVDKYPGCSVGKIAVEKAESKYIEVAAASILARSAGLEQLNFLSKKAGFTLPKGSTHVKEALQMLVDKKLKMKVFVKLHFRNVREFL